MKRPILFIALAALLVATSCAGSGSDSKPAKKEAPERKGWSGGSLYGDVESVTITRYKLSDKFGEVVKDIDTDYSKEVYKFNSNGDVEEYSEYNAFSGALDCKSLYKYDSQGNMIEEAEYNSDGSLRWKHLDKYDSQGNLIEQAYYNSDGWLKGKSLYKYKYDTQGNEIEQACYYVGVFDDNYKYISKYDSQGNKIEVARYDSDGSLDHKYIYKYDSQGNWIEKVEYEGEIMKPTRMVELTIVYRK